jgi:hypothetical protein
MPRSRLSNILWASNCRQVPTSTRWWGNNDPGCRHTASWLNAGWEAQDLNLSAKRVTFRRIKVTLGYPTVEKVVFTMPKYPRG